MATIRRRISALPVAETAPSTSEVPALIDGLTYRLELATILTGLNTGIYPLTPWVTATSYGTDRFVVFGFNIYRSLVAHTSGVFATDLADGKWIEVIDFQQLIDDAEAARDAALAAETAAETAQGLTEAARDIAVAAKDDAETAADTATTAASSASASAASAATLYDAFDDRYLGAKTSDPALDNDGNALIDGALYFNTIVPALKVYDLSTTTWLVYAASGGDMLKVNYDSNADDKVDAADYADTAPWGGISGTPTTLAGYGITDAQELDATLTALAGVATAADKLIYATGSDAFTTTDLTAAGRAILDDADAAAQRTTLGLGNAATFNEMTAAEYWANTADRLVSTDRSWAAAETVALSDGATITPDFGAGLNFTVTLGGNRTLAAPSNPKVGQSGFIAITQDGTGSRTLAFNANYKWAGGTDGVLTTTASAVDLLYYTVRTTSAIDVVLLKGMA